MSAHDELVEPCDLRALRGFFLVAISACGVSRRRPDRLSGTTVFSCVDVLLADVPGRVFAHRTRRTDERLRRDLIAASGPLEPLPGDLSQFAAIGRAVGADVLQVLAPTVKHGYVV